MFKLWKIDTMKISRNGVSCVRESLNKWMNINMFINKSIQLIHLEGTKYFMKLKFLLKNWLIQLPKILNHQLCKESNLIWKIWFNSSIFNKTIIRLILSKNKILIFLMLSRLTIKHNRDKKKL